MTKLWHWLVYGSSATYTRTGCIPWGGVVGAIVLLLVFIAWAWWSGR